MDYREFRRHLGKAGISIQQFSQLLGVRASSVSNYSAKGAVPLTYATIAVLAGQLRDEGQDVIGLLSRFGISVNAVHPLAQLRS